MTDPKDVLIVEDSSTDFFIVKRAINKAGLAWNIHWVQTGDDALDFFHQQGRFGGDENTVQPELILLDLNLPGLDGRGVLRHVQSDTRLAAIPVVILSTSSDKRDIEDCAAMGARSYITKPADFKAFVKAIAQLDTI